MNFRYLAYTADMKMTRGVQVADSSDVAAKILTGNGFKILSLKPESSFLANSRQISFGSGKIPPGLLVSFSRQFALLHESGTNIVTTLELMLKHISNPLFKKVLSEIIVDVNKGSSLSSAMSKHPEVFSKVYLESVKLGEESGNLETALRQMADYIEKEIKSAKGVQNALRYPVIVAIVAVIVVIVLVTYALPTFINLYKSLNVQLPLTVRLLISATDWFSHYGLFLLIGFAFAVVVVVLWSRSPEGKLQKDKFMLNMPVLGRVAHLSELSRCCRNISVLYKAGSQVPDILTMVIDSATNTVIKQALTKVYKDVVKGEGLSRPMSKDPIFLDLMVQMAGVGETTGSLDKTMMATAETYESEAAEKMNTFISLIQPALTIAIGLAVGFVAITLISAMYSMYGQMGS
jgi:type IV pilus assembly protein PilC